MATLDVLDAVRDVCDSVVGITTAYKLTPEAAIPADRLPAAIVSLDRERQGFIQLHGHEEWHWPVQVDILIARTGDIQTEQAAVIPLMEAFIAATRGNMNLDGTGAFQSDVFWQYLVLSYWQETYSAIRIQTTVQQHFEVAAQYGN